MLELEGAAVTEGWMQRLQAAFTDHAQEGLWQRLIAGYMEFTPTGGIHIYYRIDGDVHGNTKLASRPTTTDEQAQHPGQRTRVMIETRGEGGWSIVAPSRSRTHPTGAAWTALPDRSPRQIATFTTDERDTIHAMCRLLDEAPATASSPVVPATSPRPTIPAEDRLRPGDDFNARASWADILQPHGWTIDHAQGGTTYWIRPGKKRGQGVSATTGHSTDGADRLYVFSTSTDFQPEIPYSKLGAYAVLNHGGDHSSAASALHTQGWGDQTPAPPRTLTLLPVPRDGQDEEAPTTDGATALAPITPITPITAATQPGTSASPWGCTDQSNAELMAAEHAHHLRYEPSRGQWLQWDGTRWAWCDDDGEATQAAISTIQRINPADKEAAKHITRSLSRRGLEACVALARRHAAMRIPINRLDADPYALNTPAGIIDLRTGDLRAAGPDDWCTRATSAAPAPGDAPRWQRFLTDTFEDPELIGYVQRLAGYSAIGEVLHHVLPFFFGSGGNGKSVFVDVISNLLGDYASSAPPNFLMAGRDDESAIARLHGLRLVASSEVAQSARFDEAKVKLLTGGDRITARFLYGRHFTYTPSVTLWMMGNHQPRVEAGGESFWRRLRLVPFTRTVPPEKRVEKLAQILAQEEGPQILHWIIQGAIDVLQGGMRTPASVTAATQTYATEEDALGRFVADRINLSGVDAAREPTATVRAAYLQWCRDEGEVALSAQAFGRELRSRFGIKTSKSNGKRLYVGMILYADPDDESGDERDRFGRDY